MDQPIKFSDKFLVEVPGADRVFKRTETLDEYTARGGIVTKCPKGKLLWTYEVRSTVGNRRNQVNSKLLNYEQEEI